MPASMSHCWAATSQDQGISRGRDPGLAGHRRRSAAGVDLAISKYGPALKLDPKQQLAEAKVQNTLVVSPDTEAHGLFWMSPAAIQQNLQTLSLTGTAATPALFDNSLLEEIYAGRSHI
jgi:hypothetical protein